MCKFIVYLNCLPCWGFILTVYLAGGKRNVDLILPTNSSISISLAQNQVINSCKIMNTCISI